MAPPGTGKTTVIYSWVKHFAQQGKRVLVSSQNNKAVDNMLERLAYDKSLECLRVGDEMKVADSVRELLIENKAVNYQQRLLGALSANIAACEVLATQIPGSMETKDSSRDFEFVSNLHKDFAPFCQKSSELKKRISALEAQITAFSRRAFWHRALTFMAHNARKGAHKTELQNQSRLADDAAQMQAFFAKLSEILKAWRQKAAHNRQDSLYELFLENVNVVGATCIGINSKNSMLSLILMSLLSMRAARSSCII